MFGQEGLKSDYFRFHTVGENMAPSPNSKEIKPERDEKLNPKIQSLKQNMAKIGMDQQRIREAQRNVRQMFASINRNAINSGSRLM